VIAAVIANPSRRGKGMTVDKQKIEEITPKPENVSPMAAAQEDPNVPCLANNSASLR
jgi:hypothetical protein